MAPLPLLLLRVTALPWEALEPLAAPRTVGVLDRRQDLEAEIDAGAPDLADALFAAAGPPEPEAGREAARARLAVVALRRAVFNRRDLSPGSLDRARPRLPPELLQRLDAYTRHREELAGLEGRVAATFSEELGGARATLRQRLATPELEAAVRLVSRSLLERLRSLGPPETWRHDERHAAAKLLAYLDRAAAKTSPNGLFCATALAGWTAPGEGPGVARENRLSRLDVLLNVVEARKVAACLGSGPAAWPALVPRVNPTLRREEEIREEGEESAQTPGETGENPAGGPGAWVFWRSPSLAEEGNDEVLRRLARHPVAEVFVELARPGERTVPDLLAAAAQATDIPESDLAGFFAKLAEAGLLSGEIELPTTCRRPLAGLAEVMRGHGASPPWLAEVEAIEHGVEQLAALPPRPRIEAMDRLADRLGALPHTRALETDELFRVDAASALAVTLPEEIRAELRDAVGAYARLFAALYPRRSLRHSLARSFLASHGPDREVNLLELYRSSPLREGAGRPLGFPETAPGNRGEGSNDAPEATLARARRWFADRARKAETAGRGEVEISAADWDHLAGPGGEPPWAAGVLFQVAAASPADLAAGRWRLTVNDLFTGAGLALARFAHLHGAEGGRGPNPVTEELGREIRRLARPGAVLAEVTYNHWGRTANAGLRMPFLEHEIELPGELASPGTTVIPLREMTLSWSSAEERLVLRWPRRGVEVLPVITSGVSPEGFVSLLVGIGRQAIQPLAYFPGFEVEGVCRWPRFTHGRVVVFRRRWIFPPGSFPEPPAESGDPDALLGDFFTRLHHWRRREDLPRHVFAATSQTPKPFHLDLESPLSADLLRHRLAAPEGVPPERPAPTLYLTEMLPGPEEMWVTDRHGRYASEFLVQLGS